MSQIQAGPARVTDRAAAETRARAVLRQAIWEASQFMDDGEIAVLTDRVLAEIAVDEP